MRRYREAPYSAEAAASKARKMARPKDLLRWFLEGYRAELPDRLHTRGVWRDRVSSSEAENGIGAVGGSLLGTPRTADPFRAYIDDSPFALETAEYEGHKDIRSHYRTPMRAALARLSGRGADTDPYPFMARVLFRTALRDGDWDSACASLGIIEPVRKPYIEAALHRLFDRYHEEPPAYTVRTSGKEEAA